MGWIIMRDLKEFWNDNFTRKKGLSIWQGTFWNDCVEYYWPKPKTKMMITIEECL